ncbi:MAG: 2-isopropylmalate synthase [Lentisphaerae bacterium]|jgi:2-isopropylmalate synthase|nr:2-isopropylmalate synthase [Lentisphaerota bacterium]MBT4816645.1 2-isopropylmalate synthase [Lentisphaerota bacterium]MBT5610064.1 2-isopropylmalate synthase [Lentisphaerota bacterium]MBT7055536.1 2-isopropylmalate synthase [Lentisphaerota bacterium]MBT7841509.1 2-isopropylmalate synthase [Lentisphaerota bacterium]
MRPKYAQPDKIEVTCREWPDHEINCSPTWCAVDLRDGNQALPNPLTPIEKKRYYEILIERGFKEIEIGFPSASADDFNFCRDVIEQDMIPDDVCISVLTQAREHLIRRTFEALAGVKQAICHVYIASSDLHTKFVFGKTREETTATAVESVRLIRELAKQMPDSDIKLEFSPEEFTDTDLDYAVELCDSVVAAWGPEGDEKVILNLPATVERRPPHHYADMIEEFNRRQSYRDSTVISLHTHNDMGGAIASTEMALMAGADRVEGTLFGHGERSGNVDLITLALNLQYLGVETGLDFGNLEVLRDELIQLSGLPVHPRHPYAGELVFTAFSGSHQDAIHKGLRRREELAEFFGGWKVPYLHIDPEDLGRSYERFIRINSQSGKGGIAHVLETEHGIRLPRAILVDLSKQIQAHADSVAREVQAGEVWDIFLKQYVRPGGPFQLINYWPRPTAEDPARIDGEVHLELDGKRYEVNGIGAGPIAAFVHAIRTLDIPRFSLEEYEEDAIGNTADAEAVTFVRLEDEQGGSHFGVGFGSNIDQAAVRAVVSGLNSILWGRS